MGPSTKLITGTSAFFAGHDQPYENPGRNEIVVCRTLTTILWPLRMSASREFSKFEVIVGRIRQKIMVVSRVCELRLSVLAGRAGIAVRILLRPPFSISVGWPLQ